MPLDHTSDTGASVGAARLLDLGHDSVADLLVVFDEINSDRRQSAVVLNRRSDSILVSVRETRIEGHRHETATRDTDCSGGLQAPPACYREDEATVMFSCLRRERSTRCSTRNVISSLDTASKSG